MLYFYILGIGCMSMMMVGTTALAGKCFYNSNYVLGLFMLAVAFLPVMVIILMLNELGVLT